MKATSLPKPRSYAAAALMIAGISALPFALLWSWAFAAMQGLPFADVLTTGLIAGVCFGVFFGLTMGFFIKGVTASIKAGNVNRFISRLEDAVSALGYKPSTQSESLLTYKPSFRAGLAAGRITVLLENGRAVIVAPRMYVRRLLERLQVNDGSWE